MVSRETGAPLLMATMPRTCWLMVADGSAIPRAASERPKLCVRAWHERNRLSRPGTGRVWQRQTRMNRRHLFQLVSAVGPRRRARRLWKRRLRRRTNPRRHGRPNDTRATPATRRPADTLPLPEGFAHPTGPDDEIVNYSEVGGFTTMEYAFQQPPMVLISGDGRVFTDRTAVAIYPGPALPNIQVGTITEEGIQTVLDRRRRGRSVRRRRVRGTDERRGRDDGLASPSTSMGCRGSTRHTRSASARGLKRRPDRSRPPSGRRCWRSPGS